MDYFWKKLAMNQILKYFPELAADQIRQFEMLGSLYADWNSKINVISRKDIDELYTRHILHSLAIAKIQPFVAGSKILDVGTGGGFPGIPLAILYPDVHFHLIDVIGKKITVVKAVADSLGLHNVKAEQVRAEHVTGKYDFVISRAVTNMPDFVSWVKRKIAEKSNHDLKNGILYLKGGDLTDELAVFSNVKQFDIPQFFSDAFFETKKVVYLPVKYKP